MKNIGTHANAIEIRTDKEFVVLSFYNNGIKLICKNELSAKDMSRVIYRFGYIKKQFYLPTRIYKAYNFSENLEPIPIKKDVFWLIGEKINDEAILPIRPIARDFDFEKNECKKLRVKNMNKGNISLAIEECDSLILKAEAYTGKRNFVRFTPMTKPEKGIYCLDDIQAEFGQNMLMYPYDTLTYYLNGNFRKTCMDKGRLTSARIPASIIRAWNLALNSSIQTWKYQNNLIISPLERNCDIDGKVINPLTECANTIRVCEECENEEDILKEVIGLIKNIGDMCKKIRNKTDNLEDRISAIEFRLEK